MGQGDLQPPDTANGGKIDVVAGAFSVIYNGIGEKHLHKQMTDLA